MKLLITIESDKVTDKLARQIFQAVKLTLKECKSLDIKVSANISKEWR